MGINDLSGTIESATVFTTQVQDRRLVDTFPRIAEGWNETLEDLIHEKTDAKIVTRRFHLPHPTLTNVLREVQPSLVTFVAEQPDDAAILDEVKRTFDQVRPHLIVILAHDGDPYMNDGFYDSMKGKVAKPLIAGKDSYLDYVHAIPLSAFVREENINPTVIEAIERLSSVRKRSQA